MATLMMWHAQPVALARGVLVCHHHYTHHLFLQFVLENAMFLAFIYFCNLF